MADLTKLQAAADANSAAVDKAIAKIDALGPSDQAAVDAIADKVAADAARLDAKASA